MFSTAADLARLIDHTALKAATTRSEIDTLCQEAAAHGFWSVCIAPTWIVHAKTVLRGTSVKICTVVGFPLGNTSAAAKAAETAATIVDGADEIDMVINLGALKSGDLRALTADIAGVVGAADGRLVKTILETCYLTDEEKITAAKAAVDAGADFVKTSTGFGSAGATTADIALLRAAVGPRIGVKASGGIRDLKTAVAMVEAGATRLGLSSGIAVLREWATP